MNKKAQVLLIIGGISFIFVGIMSLFEKKYFLGIVFIIVGILNTISSILAYKKKPIDIELDDLTKESMDKELKLLIAEGKYYKAIKRCRVITGFGLKEAKEYVDLLN
ncbi:ribosomal L7/L12-like protein [Natranaerovirga pectinivora]|uniref:Ribosomal L7/L12-like protein n=1 Tax=Natranaerovirga pectinivora TaxID=682400 RepID=A0A4R3MQH6_9FIRM|nr:DNA-binding protein [Natranaerovirga pectinivora]TCT17142.1 ribosomal L7/L12-like protein [Natranaerovirga pectinivora]